MSDENKVASIDIHKKVLMVVVGSREGDAIGSQGELERRRFGTRKSRCFATLSMTGGRDFHPYWWAEGPCHTQNDIG